MKTSLGFFDHIGTIFDPLLSLQGTLSPTRQNAILHEMNFYLPLQSSRLPIRAQVEKDC